MPRQDWNLGFPITIEICNWKRPRSIWSIHLHTWISILKSLHLICFFFFFKFPRAKVLQSWYGIWEKIIILKLKKNHPHLAMVPFIPDMFADFSVVSSFVGIQCIFLVISLKYLVSSLLSLLEVPTLAFFTVIFSSDFYKNIFYFLPKSQHLCEGVNTPKEIRYPAFPSHSA